MNEISLQVHEMAGRPCSICADAAKLKLAVELIAAGATDQSVADRIGGINRMAVARHRQNHNERPARAVVEAANKGKDVRDEREQLVAAAEAGDVAVAFLSLERIAGDLRRVQERLERTAEAAEIDKQRLAVASLSGQQLRAAEVRAKLGGIGGYAPRAEKPDGSAFVLNIIFGDGQETRIEGVPMHPGDAAFNAVPASPLSPGGTHVLAAATLSGDEDLPEEDV